MESKRGHAMAYRNAVIAGIALLSIAAVAGIYVGGRGKTGARPLAGTGGQAPLAVSQASATAGSSGSHFIGDLPGAPPARQPDGSANGIATYVVVLDGEPLARYRGGLPGLPAPKRKMGQNGRYKLDTRGPEAVAYVEHLQARQKAFEARMGASLGTSVPVRARMQHALDAIVVDLAARDAARVARMPGVRLVQAERDYPLETDTGPALIGAAQVWAGTVPGLGTGYRGEGMVVGILDSGINFGAPSFAATGPVDGYVHVNPLGSGTYLGSCAPGGVDQGRCNAKLVGGYDFVCNAPANQCGQTDIREEPGFGDTDGHGTHVASTAAGNTRDVSFNGSPTRISGVAPRANLIAYDVCYTKVSTSEGLCPGSASLAAVEQVIADGIVDAINFSIGGGQDPWGDAVSMAFLSAVDAGVYVATSGGNSGPTANTLSHLEPWVATTAAAQHGKGEFSILMSVTGPAPVPSNLVSMVATPGSDGVTFSATIPAGTPMRISPTIDSGTDGCSAFAANAFSGAIAVIRRGSCTFSIKANNAAAAGAIAMVVANNQAGGLIPSVPGTTIPVFAVTQTNGDALRTFGLANPAATATLPYPAVRVPNAPDVLGSFSSRGPAGTYELVKPDITAPGVSILAAYAGTSISGSEGLIGILSGTSMASPHNTGAATLLRQVRPTWTPPEVKSALMMTATDQVWTEDGVTPANAFAAGAGRIRLANAINAGLVLNETTARFTSFDPLTGSDLSGLNLPSMAERSCVTTCSFTRTFRSTRTYGSLWQVGVQGLSGTVPTLVWVPAGSTVQVVVTIDAAALPADGAWRFGKLVLQERFTGQIVDTASELHLPIAILKPSAKTAAIGPVSAGNGGLSASVSVSRLPWLVQGPVPLSRMQAGTQQARPASR